MSVQVGQLLDGKYRITRLIGQGGMGAVYEGIHQLIDRRVAIKVLLPTGDPSAAVRFEQEARAAGRIGNDHILEILDIGDVGDGSKYMVCEFLDGQPFGDLIAERTRLSAGEVAPLIVQLLAGLGAAHKVGVLHRDLKPDNIFVLRQKAGKKDFIKIIDFGISKFTQHGGDEGLNMTKTGMLVGTPNYMSPEQARGTGGVDARADIYAVGVMMYEALTGRLPFEAETFNDLLFKVVLETPAPVSSHVPDVDPVFHRIVEKAMARDPADRYQDCAEFAMEVESWLRSQTGIPRGTLQLATHAPTILATSFPLAPVNSSIQTPAAFGRTGERPILHQPWWDNRKLQIAAGVVVMLFLGLIVLISRGGSTSTRSAQGDEDPGEAGPATKQLAAATATPEAPKPEPEPTLPAKEEAVADITPPAPEPSRPELERPASPAPRPALPALRPAQAASHPATQPTIVAPAPAPAPMAPSPRPKRPNFGY